MINFRFSLLSLLLCGFMLPALAQRTITFGQDDERDNRKGRKPNKSLGANDYARNSVTINLLGWISGQTQVYYERGFNDVLSAAVGAGVTTRPFTMDVFSDLGFGQESDNFNGSGGGGNTYNQDLDDDYSAYRHRKSRPGLALSFSPKVYYRAEGMDGGFIAPRVEYKKFRWQAEMLNTTTPTQRSYSSDLSNSDYGSGTQAESVRCLDLTINWGGHYQTGNRVVISWSSGFGVRSMRGERQDLGMRSYDGGTSYYYVNAVREIEKTTFLAAFTFAIGGCF